MCKNHPISTVKLLVVRPPKKGVDKGGTSKYMTKRWQVSSGRLTLRVLESSHGRAVCASKRLKLPTSFLVGLGVIRFPEVPTTRLLKLPTTSSLSVGIIVASRRCRLSDLLCFHNINSIKDCRRYRLHDLLGFHTINRTKDC